jgi:starvation-inducible DNA-binding protein
MRNTATRSAAVPSALTVPSNLGAERCESVAIALNPLVADAFALYVKTKNYHWHISGPHFPDYHRMLDKQADQILEMTDDLAERSRKLGQLTIHSIGEIARLQNVDDDNRAFVEPVEMLHTLMNDNSGLVDRMRTGW